MCNEAPAANTAVTTADKYSQFYVGDNFSAVDFMADDSVDASGFNLQVADKYVPHQGKVKGYWTQKTIENLPVGHFGNRKYAASGITDAALKATGVVQPNKQVAANQEARSAVSRQADGSYLGNITSRKRADGTNEYGRYKFSSRPHGEYSLIDGKLGIAEQNDKQRVRRASDTRGIATHPKQSKASSSLRNGGSAKKKGTSSFTVVPDTNSGAGSSAGFTVPTG
jgi:hypothetical protein